MLLPFFIKLKTMISESKSGFNFKGKRAQNGAPGVLDTDLVTKSQLDAAINTTLEGNDNDFTGNNTHSGTETFSNAAGVTTDIITERTAGAGTGIKKPVLTVTAATLTSATTPAISATTSGTTYALAKADGQTVTLPALSATNIGVTYKFVIKVSCTSVGYVINTTGTDVFIGGVWQTIANPGAGAANDFEFSTSTANKTMTLDATTKCGLIGGWVELTAISATQWHVSGVILGTGTVATPFSN
jgi:hypothetical protein